MKILMVCLGNICRSPLAEGILKHKVSKNIVIDSAGTAGYHIGSPPDKRSIEIAKKYGIDISKQKARKFDVKDFEEFDIIYVMDTSNYSDLLEILPNAKYKDKVKLILKEAPQLNKTSVPDPYYGTIRDFEEVYQLLDIATNSIINNILIK